VLHLPHAGDGRSAKPGRLENEFIRLPAETLDRPGPGGGHPRHGRCRSDLA
jgi:hypothetical protein